MEKWEREEEKQQIIYIHNLYFEYCAYYMYDTQIKHFNRWINTNIRVLLIY